MYKDKRYSNVIIQYYRLHKTELFTVFSFFKQMPKIKFKSIGLLCFNKIHLHGDFLFGTASVWSLRIKISSCCFCVEE